MKYVTEKPSGSFAVVYLEEGENGVSIHVGDWAVAMIHKSGMLRLVSSVPPDNKEGLVIGPDECIMIDLTRF